jgi:hypothetical protein
MAALPNAFCSMGHGQHIAGPKKTVPDGCTYVTIEIPGRSSVNLPIIYLAFNDPNISTALRYPSENFELLKQYFRFDKFNNFKIRTAGQTYSDDLTNLFTHFDDILFKSGFYQLGNTPLYNKRADHVVDTLYVNESEFKTNPDFYIRECFKGSLIMPNLDAPIPTSFHPQGDLIQRFGQSKNITFSALMAHFGPGVYYNFACRSVEYSDDPLVLEQRQKAAALQAQASVNVGKLQRHNSIRPTIGVNRNGTNKRQLINGLKDWVQYINHYSQYWITTTKTPVPQQLPVAQQNVFEKLRKQGEEYMRYQHAMAEQQQAAAVLQRQEEERIKQQAMAEQQQAAAALQRQEEERIRHRQAIAAQQQAAASPAKLDESMADVLQSSAQPSYPAKWDEWWKAHAAARQQQSQQHAVAASPHWVQHTPGYPAGWENSWRAHAAARQQRAGHSHKKKSHVRYKKTKRRNRTLRRK